MVNNQVRVALAVFIVIVALVASLIVAALVFGAGWENYSPMNTTLNNKSLAVALLLVIDQ